MSLQVWLPLNRDLHNQGLNKVIPTNNGAVINNAGKIGKCYSFGTVASDITLPATSMANFTTEASVSFWIKILSWNTSYATFFQAGPASTAWTAYRFGILRNNANSNLCFTISNGSSASNANYTTSNLELNTWYHLSFCYKTGHCLIYVNGTLYKDYTTTIVPDFTGITTIKIGRCTNNSSYQTNCLLNDFRIYDHCLSDKEVEEISKGLVLHYQLNGSGFKNPNLLLDTNVSSLTKVKASHNRYYESGSSGTYTAIFESINDPPVAHIKYGVHYTVTSVGGFHGLTWYNGGTVSVTNEPYTISCYVKKISTGNMSIKFQYGKSPYVSKVINLINDNQWHQYSWTFTPDTASGKAAADGATRIYGGGPSTVGEVIICGWKLEKGKYVTPWCESEDEGFEPSLIIYDSSGYNNNGNISSGNIELISSPRYSVGSGSLNAINTKIITTLNGLPSILANGEKYTLACWARPTGTNANGWVIQLGNNQCGLWWAKSEARWVWNENDNGKRCANPTISSDYTNWHHLVTTIDKTNSAAIVAKHYVDGQPAEGYTSQTWNGSTFTQPTGDTITYYLQNSDLSDVRLYTTILTADQIKELYEISKIIDGTTVKARDLEVST